MCYLFYSYMKWLLACVSSGLIEINKFLAGNTKHTGARQIENVSRCNVLAIGNRLCV
jgi:hypothetical protein